MPVLAADTTRDGPDRVIGEILHDLIDALVAEGLLAVEPRPAPGPDVDRAARPGGGGPSAETPGGGRCHTRPDAAGSGERWAEAPVGGGRRLVFRVRPAVFPRPWRFSRGPVLLAGPAGSPSTPVGPVDVLRAVARPEWAALDLVADDLTAAGDAVAQSDEAAPRVVDALMARGLTGQAGEQLAALGDRPFHPLGRHKRGWHPDDRARWGPHTPDEFGLAWWAVPRSLLARGEATDLGPADVLDPPDRARLDRALARRRVGGDHVALPVHPWQARRLGGPGRGIVALVDGLGRFRATASLRTLVPAGRPDLHLKLPMGVVALGAGRQLPLRYLRNGDRAQRLLAAVTRHPALGGRLHVCDETAWWTTPGPSHPADGGSDETVQGVLPWLRDGELGCQLRCYPAALAADPGVALVPLGALGVTVGRRAPALDALAGRGDGRVPAPVDRRTGTALLAELTGELVRLAVVCLAHGVMPELHGQNVVVAVRHGGPGEPGSPAVAGLVLRDHDAVRIHPPWLRAAGLPDPGYVVDGRTPNTLVADSPEGLLGWFQMLGVHLGLFPVVRALGVATGLDEAAGWRAVAAATARCLEALDGLLADGGRFGSDGDAGGGELGAAAEVARRCLLAEPTWPVKLALGPLLERGAACGTSMPSAVGTTANPLRGRAR